MRKSKALRNRLAKMRVSPGAKLLAVSPHESALDNRSRVDLCEPEHKCRPSKDTGEAPPDLLTTLRDDFDRLIEHMQKASHNAAVDALFTASGAKLGAVAAAHARESSRLRVETKEDTAAKKKTAGSRDPRPKGPGVKREARASPQPDEVSMLLASRKLTSTDYKFVPIDNTLSLSEPKDAPQVFLEALRALFARHLCIKTAHIAHLHRAGQSSLLIIVDAERDVASIMGEMATIIDDTLRVSIPVDITRLQHDESPVAVFARRAQPFYKRGRRVLHSNNG